MSRYRYRTPALTGRWRESRQAAADDAVKARQAVADTGAVDGLCWLVPGEIEERDNGAAGAAAERRRA